MPNEELNQTVMTMRVPDGHGSHIETGPFTGADLKKALAAVGETRGPKPDPEFDAAKDKAYRVTAGVLRKFIERFEQLAAEKQDIADQQKEVMAEAKARGYDTKVLRKVIALRARDKDDIAEEQAVLDLYLDALGM